MCISQQLYATTEPEEREREVKVHCRPVTSLSPHPSISFVVCFLSGFTKQTSSSCLPLLLVLFVCMFYPACPSLPPLLSSLCSSLSFVFPQFSTFSPVSTTICSSFPLISLLLLSHPLLYFLPLLRSCSCCFPSTPPPPPSSSLLFPVPVSFLLFCFLSLYLIPPFSFLFTLFPPPVFCFCFFSACCLHFLINSSFLRPPVFHPLFFDAFLCLPFSLPSLLFLSSVAPLSPCPPPSLAPLQMEVNFTHSPEIGKK